MTDGSILLIHLASVVLYSSFTLNAFNSTGSSHDMATTEEFPSPGQARHLVQLPKSTVTGCAGF